MATKSPSRAIKLFGTTVVDSKGRVLRAGPLSAVLDNGQLRYIRVNDIEVLRAIAFLVRDENWGTFTPEISNLKVKQGKTGFSVTYRARCADAKRALTYDAEITGDVTDGLKFSATATPESDFLTNRTGFVVLHPLQGVAGKPVKVMHVDGRSEKSRFPKIINPVQPFYDIHALSHEIAPGNLGDLPHGGRQLRDGGPPQLDRRLLQDLCAAPGGTLALHSAGGKVLRSGGQPDFHPQAAEAQGPRRQQENRRHAGRRRRHHAAHRRRRAGGGSRQRDLGGRRAEGRGAAAARLPDRLPPRRCHRALPALSSSSAMPPAPAWCWRSSSPARNRRRRNWHG